MKPAVDTTLGDGRYRLERRVGAGGMASVWLAVDARLGRPVAVKIVADTIAGDEQWLRRFKREAQAAAMISHAGVVPVFDYGVEDGRPYLVMEYVPGGTLAGRLADSEAAPPAPGRLARELLEALGVVHAAGILHRDVKPANLLFDSDGHIRLTDFGIAQPQDATALTSTGMIVGTLRYIAPEVAHGEPASVQSDLYSAGVVIGEAAGAEPPAALRPLITALTAEDPRHRPASAAAALELLAPEATGDVTAPTAVRPSAEPETRLLPPTRRGSTAATRPLNAAGTARLRDGSARRRPELLAAAGVLLLVIVVIIVATSGGGSSSGGGGSSGAVPQPASAGASVSQQVQQLQRIVQSSTRR